MFCINLCIDLYFTLLEIKNNSHGQPELNFSLLRKLYFEYHFYNYLPFQKLYSVIFIILNINFEKIDINK